MYRSLIIDDEKPVQIAISKLGHFTYYDIESPRYAVNGKDGLSAMREYSPGYRLCRYVYACYGRL